MLMFGMTISLLKTIFVVFSPQGMAQTPGGAKFLGRDDNRNDSPQGFTVPLNASVQVGRVVDCRTTMGSSVPQSGPAEKSQSEYSGLQVRDASEAAETTKFFFANTSTSDSDFQTRLIGHR